MERSEIRERRRSKLGCAKERGQSYPGFRSAPSGLRGGTHANSPSISATRRSYRGRTNFIATRAGARLSDAAGACYGGVRSWRSIRHLRTDRGAEALRAIRKAILRGKRRRRVAEIDGEFAC